MKVFGLRIGQTGLEFQDKDERENAIAVVTRGSGVRVSDYQGPRYMSEATTFSVYERETDDNTTNCSKCNGQFKSPDCRQVSVPKTDWSGKFLSLTEVERKYLCEPCAEEVASGFELFREAENKRQKEILDEVLDKTKGKKEKKLEKKEVF